MYTVSNEFKSSCRSLIQTGRLGKITIVADGVDITQEDNLINFTVDSEISSSSNGFLGSTIAKKLTAKVINDTGEYDFEDKELTVSAGLNIGSGTPEYVEFGSFFVEKNTDKEVRYRTEIVAFDSMVKFNIPYVDTNTYPCTVETFISNMCQFCGVELGSSSFTNYDYIIAEPLVPDNKLFITVLSEICGSIVGGYAIIGKDNKLYINNILPDIDDIEEEITIDGNDYTSFSRNKQYGKINSLIYQSIDENLLSVTVNNTASITANGLKQVTIPASIFVKTQANMQSIAEGLFEIYDGLFYTPFKATITGMPFIDSGDIIKIKDIEDNEYNTVVFNHKFMFNGGFNSEISCDELTNNQRAYNNTTSFDKALAVSKKSTLQEAQTNATELINTFNGGFVIKQGGELFIADKEDLNTANRVWRWNLNGLAYSNTGKNGPYKLAITMDGAIVADFITTGYMNVDRIVGSFGAEEITSLDNELTSMKLASSSIEFALKKAGGNNLIKDSTLRLGYEGNFKNGTVTVEQNKEISDNTISKSAIKINTGSLKFEPIIIKDNEDYTFSCLIYKLALSNIQVKITSAKEEIYNIECEADKFIDFEFTLNNFVGQVIIELLCDNNYALFSDCMFNKGVKLGYQPYQGELIGENYKFSDGLEITSTPTNSKLIANSEGIKVVNSETGKIKADFNGDNTILDRVTIKERMNVGPLRHTKMQNGHIMVTFDEED